MKDVTILISRVKHHLNALMIFKTQMEMSH